MSLLAILVWALQPVATCPDGTAAFSSANSITTKGEVYFRLNAKRLRSEIVGHWVSDPPRQPGEAYRFIDVIRFDRAGSFEDFDDRGGEYGRYKITEKGMKLVGGMRDKPELMVFFRSRSGRVLAGIDHGQPCPLQIKVLNKSGR